MKDLKKMKLGELVALHNRLNPKKPVKKFESKAVAVKRVSALAPKKQSKVGIIRGMFAEKPSWTVEELMARSGFDANNVRVAMTILRNPKRTKPENLLVTSYDKEAGTYTTKGGDLDTTLQETADNLGAILIKH
jgi:hypothetical protein